jgi:4-hydroxy-3-polyprenylbenzoate decarboxylase
LGFGGKMCIDGTVKSEEEKNDGYVSNATIKQVESEKIIELFPEIKIINDSLLKKDIPCLFVSVQKSRKGHIKELHEQLCQLENIKAVKMILYVEHTVDANDLTTALWRFCNNLDPKRDHHIVKYSSTSPESFGQTSNNYAACIGFDGTRKTKEFDDFNRDWPNIIVADTKTIEAIDKKWDSLGIGEFLPSPSLKFKDQLYGEEAVVNAY